MKLAGTTAGVTSGASLLSGSARAATTVHGMTFDRTVNVVDDLGVDPTGGRAVDDAIESAATDGTLLVFPAGEYRWTGTNSVSDGLVGFQGDGDVRFTFPQGFNDYFLVIRGREALFENITIDISQENTVTGMKVMCPDGFHVENVEYVGRGTHDSGSRIPYALIAHVESSDATGTVKNLVATQGSAWAHYNGADGRIGIYAGGGHEGTLRIVDCHLEEFGNNGIYANDNAGNVQIEGGVYRNNNVDAIRIGGAGSYVDGALIEVDPAKYTGPHTREGSAFNMRGIVIAQKPEKWGWKDAGVEVRNCDIRIADNPSNSSAAINVWHAGRTLQVTNTNIRMEMDRPAIRRDAQGGGGSRPSSSDPRWVRCDNVSVTGTADGGAVVDARDANGSEVTNSCIYGTGDNRTGVRFSDSSNCAVSDSTVNVSGTTVSGTSNVENVSESGTCSLDGGNQSPTASFTISPSSPVVDETVTLDGSGSSDPDGSIQSYAWTIERPSGSTFSLAGESPTFTPDESGTYSVSLTVTDGGGLESTAAEEVSVEGGNQSPTASFTVSPSSPTVDETVTLDGSGSSDPDGSIQSYAWTIERPSGSTFSRSGESTTFTPDESGSYGVTLTVTDGGGLDHSTSETVSVDDEPDDTSNTLEVIAAEESGGAFDYEVTADGPITLVTDAGQDSAEGNDDVTDNGDGTYTLSGVVGSGYGDTFTVEGDVLSFDAETDDSNYTLYWNGEQVTADELTGGTDDTPDTPSTLEVIAAEESGGAFDYEVTADGPITLVTGIGRNSAEGNDDVTDNGDGTYTLSGVVGSGFGDTFTIEGSVLSFDADTDDSNYTLYWNDEQVTADELTGQ